MPKLSRSHKKNMRKIFRLFEKNKRAMIATAFVSAGVCADSKSAEKHFYYIHKRPVLIFVIILVAFFLTGFGSWQFINGFLKREFSDNTQLFAVNIDENCPDSIEEQYGLSVLPEGYELCEVYPSGDNVMKIYKNNFGQELIFGQYVKSEFDLHVDNEHGEIIETEICGYKAVYIETEREEIKETFLIWDSKNYVLTLSGIFIKEDIIDLAVSNEFAGFQKIRE